MGGKVNRAGATEGRLSNRVMCPHVLCSYPTCWTRYFAALVNRKRSLEGLKVVLTQLLQCRLGKVLVLTFLGLPMIRRCGKLPISSLLLTDSKDYVPCKKSGRLSPEPVLMFTNHSVTRKHSSYKMTDKNETLRVRRMAKHGKCLAPQIRAVRPTEKVFL